MPKARARVLGGAEVGRHLEALVEHLDLLHALDREGPHLAVLLGAGVEVEPSPVVDEAVGVEVVGLRPPAVERVVGDPRLALVEDGVDEAGNDVLLPRVVLPGVGARREEVLDAGEEGQALLGQRLPDLREGRLQVLPERGPAEEREHVPAEVEGGELGEAEALGELLPVPLDQAPDLLPARAVVVDREARLLQRLDVAADRALGHAELVGELRGAREAPRLDRLQDPPLPDDLGVPHVVAPRARCILADPQHRAAERGRPGLYFARPTSAGAAGPASRRIRWRIAPPGSAT